MLFPIKHNQRGEKPKQSKDYEYVGCQLKQICPSQQVSNSIPSSSEAACGTFVRAIGPCRRRRMGHVSSSQSAVSKCERCNHLRQEAQDNADRERAGDRVDGGFSGAEGDEGVEDTNADENVRKGNRKQKLRSKARTQHKVSQRNLLEASSSSSGSGKEKNSSLDLPLCRLGRSRQPCSSALAEQTAPYLALEVPTTPSTERCRHEASPYQMILGFRC